MARGQDEAIGGDDHAAATAIAYFHGDHGRRYAGGEGFYAGFNGLKVGCRSWGGFGEDSRQFGPGGRNGFGDGGGRSGESGGG
jgi:hypothetical protein